MEQSQELSEAHELLTERCIIIFVPQKRTDVAYWSKSKIESTDSFQMYVLSMGNPKNPIMNVPENLH